VFEPDAFLSMGNDERPVCGLDITIAWPLPIGCPGIYEKFAEKVSQLDAGVYVYPLKQTHVTVLTAVNFKCELDPSESRVRIIEDAAKMLAGSLEALAGTLHPFLITFATPVLSAHAGYVPIQNPTGEIGRIRRAALQFCLQAGEPLTHAQAPTIIHATVLRFRRPPTDRNRFLCAFRQITKDVAFGSATVDEILVALEMQPYMRRGRLIRRIRLKETSSAGASPCV
jgi:hypothetical protein